LEGTSELAHISTSVGSSADKTLLRKLEQSQMDIMLDGYIAQTLTPFYTEEYLNIFMSGLNKQHGSLFVYNNQWIVARPKIAQQQQQQQPKQQKRRRGKASPSAPASKPIPVKSAADTDYEIFDRKVNLHMGTIVPQPSAIGISKKTGVLSPIFFIQRDGTLGIPYEFPFPKRSTLHNATALATTILKRGNQNARIRLQVRPLLLRDALARRVLVCVTRC